MMPVRLSISIVLGSARYGRRCDLIAQWAASMINARHDMSADLIDPLELPLSYGEHPLPQNIWHQLESRMEKADAFIVVTPEYHQGYPAVLKHLIDIVPDVWRAKPICFISYGTYSRGAKAVGQLEQVLSSLQAIPMDNSLGLERIEGYFTHNGAFQPGHVATNHLSNMLDRLGQVLHTSTITHPIKRNTPETVTFEGPQTWS